MKQEIEFNYKLSTWWHVLRPLSLKSNKIQIFRVSKRAEAATTSEDKHCAERFWPLQSFGVFDRPLKACWCLILPIGAPTSYTYSTNKILHIYQQVVGLYSFIDGNTLKSPLKLYCLIGRLWKINYLERKAFEKAEEPFLTIRSIWFT